MAIEIEDLELLVKLRKKYPKGKRLCVLGDCFFYFSNRTLFKTCNKYHDIYSYDKNRATIDTFKTALDFDEVETIDVSGKPTFKLDLSNPLPKNLKSRYDWVIDAGVLYWCFDIASVWKNIIELTKPKGYIFHISSFSGFFGRGYYSIQPRLFHDFYKANNFKIVYSAVRVRPPIIVNNSSVVMQAVIKIFKQLGLLKKKLQWQEYSPNSFYLKQSNFFSIKLSNVFKSPEPSVLPNNTLVSYFAFKEKKVTYKMPILTENT